MGYQRANSYVSGIVLKENEVSNYSYSTSLPANQVGLTGLWFASSEFIQSRTDDATLKINFIANNVYLVMKSLNPKLIKVLLDEKDVPLKYRTKDMNESGQIVVNQAKMYHIINLGSNDDNHFLTLKFPKDVDVYVFTFG